MWVDFGVLIPHSVTELYGKINRENICSGVPVWSRFTSGLAILIAGSGKDVTENLDLDFRATELRREFNYLLNSDIQPLSSNEINQLQSVRFRNLYSSWIALSGDKL